MTSLTDITQEKTKMFTKSTGIFNHIKSPSTAYPTWGVWTPHDHTLCWRNETLMQHIETLYQNTAALDRENKAHRRDYEVLQTQFSVCKNNMTPQFKTWEKAGEGWNKCHAPRRWSPIKRNFGSNFHRARETEDTEEQRQKENFPKKVDLKFSHSVRPVYLASR